MPWTAAIDGGARGNPGPSGAGLEIRDDRGRVVLAAGFFLGHMTNNQAEYEGLLRALDALGLAGARDILVLSDSELLVRQVNGSYKVHAPHLQELHQQARKKLAAFASWETRHVPREQNRQADRLANQAMDAATDVVTVDLLGIAGPLTDRPAAPTPASLRRACPPGLDLKASPPAVPNISGNAFEVRVVRGPKTCPAGHRPGQTFVFTDRTPAGLCVEACAGIIEAVLALRETAGREPGAAHTLTVTCPRSGCEGVFEVWPPGARAAGRPDDSERT